MKNEWARIAALSFTIEVQQKEAGGPAHCSPANLEISRRDARTDITSLDRRNVCAEAEAERAKRYPFVLMLERCFAAISRVPVAAKFSIHRIF